MSPTTLDQCGFAIIPDALAPEVIESMLSAVEPLLEQAKGRGGVRRLFDRVPALVTLAMPPEIQDIAASVLGEDCFVVRAILFDKTPTANWPVAWHQDLTIAVRECREVHGYGPWSVKDGIPHVLPPPDILEKMAALRLHLDDCGPTNGPLRVIPGSHCNGRLSVADAEEWRRRVLPVECHIPRGGVLVMRPLLLHASSPATQPSHRRVIHLEFAKTELAGGLEWHERWGAPEPTGPRTNALHALGQGTDSPTGRE